MKVYSIEKMKRINFMRLVAAVCIALAISSIFFSTNDRRDDSNPNQGLIMVLLTCISFDPAVISIEPFWRQLERIDYKLKKCYTDLSLDAVSNSIINVRGVLKLFNEVTNSGSAFTTGNNYCIKSTLRVKLDDHNNQQVIGVLGNHIINGSSQLILSDPRPYYQLKLRHNTDIINGIDESFWCIPQVFLAGLPKSGSSTIDSLLSMHPLIFHGISKEPRWWAPPQPPPPLNYQPKPSIEYFIKYLLQYSNDFKRYKANKNIILVDSSPNLFTSAIVPAVTDDYAEVLENVCLLPVAMSMIFPNPKYIVVLRDPIDWLYSRFWYSCSSKVYRNITLTNIEKGPYVFHSMISKRLEIFRNCTLHDSIEKCTFDQVNIQDSSISAYTCGVVALHFSIYYVHFIKWFSVIPRENFYITTYEQFFKNPELETRKLWDFLDLPQPNMDNYNWKIKHQNENRLYKTSKLKMLLTTKIMLKEFFLPLNVKLSKIIGKDLIW